VKKVFICSAIVGLLSFKIFSQTPQEPDFSGVITGRVLNKDGRPVVKAEVCASPTMIPWVGPLPCDESDSSGRFSIHIWRPAEYTIRAEKEKDGYPATDNTFYGSQAFTPDLPRVSLTEHQTRQEVTVRLGPRFGKLTGKVVDAQTGRSIEIVTVRLHHANTPTHYYSVGTIYRKGRLRILVPPVPIIFKISADGYQDWWYGADGTEGRAEALQVAPGSTRDMALSLQPIGKNK
jgi:hypothetical protein